MKRYFLIFLISILLAEVSGQQAGESLTGKVSFVSSTSTYVKFKSTDGIRKGDTLFVSASEKLIPVLVVENLSSTSCLCRQISKENLPLDHIVLARLHAPLNEKPVLSPEAAMIVSPQGKTIPDSVKVTSNVETVRPPVQGSLSAHSYSDFSNTGLPSSQRFRYTLSLKINKIGKSKVSLDSYISFRHKTGEWEEVQNDIFNALKIYSLAFRYDFNKSAGLSIGRSINPKISNMGAFDGIQFEKSLNNFSFGILAGSRPDYQNYGFNYSLFEYGGYIAYTSLSGNKRSETSLAFMEQTNDFKTDRRFLYLQHSNTFVKNLFVFGSLELDLFKLENDQPKSTFDLTGTYLSLSYRLSGRVSISGSYDARKNVIYYESYKSYTERILNEELRQGYRISGSWRFAKNMTIGLQSGYRFLKSDPNPSKNVRGFFTYSLIPGIGVSATLSAIYIETSYINSTIAGLNLLKDIKGGKVQLGAGYHYVDNLLPETKTDVVQHIGEFNIYWQFATKMSLSVNYEGTFELENQYNRIYLQIRRRF